MAAGAQGLRHSQVGIGGEAAVAVALPHERLLPRRRRQPLPRPVWRPTSGRGVLRLRRRQLRLRHLPLLLGRSPRPRLPQQRVRRRQADQSLCRHA